VEDAVRREEIDGMSENGHSDTRDLELLDQLEKLHPAVVSDCLDGLGLRNQVMAPRIRPLYPEARLAGFAVTVHVTAVGKVPDDHGDWYRGELEAVDSMRPGDVMVVSTCEACYWGELLATAATYNGARGIVADAYTRDSLRLISMQFPTFVAGISACDSLGRIDVDSVGAEIRCGDVGVNPGDLILADYDGVVVVPRTVASEVLRLAAQKMVDEDMVRRKLASGEAVSTVFQTYGII
jgi:4-hydroxy-4-methyl-2-oxoglutarate aldolase